MGLIKGILGKVNHLVINPVCHLFGNPLGNTACNPLLLIAVDEALPCLLHDGGLLLGHGSSQEIRSAHGKAGQVSHNLHNLLLIYDDSIGIFQDGFHLLTIIVYGSGIFLSRNVVRNKVHRARSIQSYSRNNVIQTGGL